MVSFGQEGFNFVRIDLYYVANAQIKSLVNSPPHGHLSWVKILPFTYL